MYLKIKRLEQQVEMERKQREKQEQKMDELIVILREGVKFIKKEQDWHSQGSDKVSASKVSKLIKRTAKDAGLPCPSSSSPSMSKY